MAEHQLNKCLTEMYSVSRKYLRPILDMNQDNYLEGALKMRNVLQEFLRHQGGKSPTILGVREHIFTGSISSLAWFMTYQETSFVTIGQRLLANPLRRCLKWKKATDNRLAAIAVGTASRGGLGKLMIRGNNTVRGVSDVGLAAIGRGCPSLKVLSWCF